MPHPFLRRQSGQTLLEYGLLLMLIAIVAFGAIQLIGGSVTTSFSAADSGLNNTPGGGDGGTSNPAEFTVTTPTPSAGSPVQFDGPSSASSWEWDFDEDGITDSTIEDPQFTFSEGTHLVSLTTNEGSYGLAIDVGPPAGPPVAAFEFVPAVPTQTDPYLTDCSWGMCYSGSDLVYHRMLVGDSIGLENQSTGVIDTYTWQMYNSYGSATWETISIDEEPTYAFTEQCQCSFRLTVSGPGGTSSTGTWDNYLGQVRDPFDEVVIRDIGDYPGTDFTQARSLNVVTSAEEMSTGGYSVEGTISCVWDKGDGSPTINTNNNNYFAYNYLPNFKYASPGTYTMTVNCTSWAGTTSDSAVWTITP